MSLIPPFSVFLFPGPPQTPPVMSKLIMLIILFIQACAIDLIEEGRNVIIQRDVEHVLIKLDVNPALKAIGRINMQINAA